MIDEAIEEPKLKKVLSYPVILLITINSIMGTGIFFLPAVGAGKAGPASILSWTILALISVYIAMCFGELTSMFPNAGGIYEFCKQSYGYFWSFLIGWTTLIAGNITIAMLIVGAIHYLLPADEPVIKITICLFFIVVFNYIAYKGMETSAVMLVTFAIITLITVLGLAIPGVLQFNPGNFTPFFALPFSAVFITIFFIAETFFGWETATFLAAETKDGEKVMPKALVIGTIIIAVIVMISVITSLNTISWTEFGLSTTPLSDLAGVHYGEKGVAIFTILVYLAIIGSVAGWIVSAPRLILAMAKDKLFLSQLSKIHPVNKTPHNAIIFQAIVTSILIIVGAGSYETLLHLLVPLVLFVYSATILCVVILRYKIPEKKRWFTCPAGKVGPFFIVLFLVSLLVMWLLYVPHSINLFLLAISFVIVGIPVFLLLKIYYDPYAIVHLNDILAPLEWLFDRFFILKSVMTEIFDLLEGERGKKILDFGAGVGTLTLHLANEVGEEGRVYAVDFSKKSLEIAQTRSEKFGLTNVEFLHDIHQINRVHQSIPPVDAIVSIGVFGYIQDLKKVLKEMYQILPEDGKICFVDYVDYFKILPNAGWLADIEELKEIFRECGFSVLVKKKKWIFWDYLFIYGIKTKENVPFV